MPMAKTALVTGSSKGIGRGIAVALAQAGYDIAVHYSSTPEGAQQTAAQVRALGRRAEIYQADIRQVPQIRAMFQAFSQDFDGLDVLVNNAGITRFTPIADATEDLWHTVMDTDLKGAYFCTQSAVEIMRGHGRGGVVVNISSNHGRGSFPNAAIYAAAKAAVNKMTENLALELARDHIRVVCIAPGYTWLEHYGEGARRGRERNVQRIPAGRYTNPEEVGAAAVFLCSEAAASITGTVLTIDGGALLPVLTDNDYV